jgi:hypothetical protein
LVRKQKDTAGDNERNAKGVANGFIWLRRETQQQTLVNIVMYLQVS